MFTEIATDDKQIAQKFILESLDSDYAMITWGKDSTGRFRASVNTDVEPDEGNGSVT